MGTLSLTEHWWHFEEPEVTSQKETCQALEVVFNAGVCVDYYNKVYFETLESLESLKHWCQLPKTFRSQMDKSVLPVGCIVSAKWATFNVERTVHTIRTRFQNVLFWIFRGSEYLDCIGTSISCSLKGVVCVIQIRAFNQPYYSDIGRALSARNMDDTSKCLEGVIDVIKSTKKNVCSRKFAVFFPLDIMFTKKDIILVKPMLVSCRKTFPDIDTSCGSHFGANLAYLCYVYQLKPI